jgi:hypothetical protein
LVPRLSRFRIARRSRLGPRRRLVTHWFVVVIAGLACAAMVTFAWPFAGMQRDGDEALSLHLADSVADAPVERIDRADSATTRPVYLHSVIPGGVYSGAELVTAIERDPVVASHYRDLDRSHLRVETVRHNRYVYVSYRKGDQIFWTRNKVMLRRGETVITDGVTQIRGRCGNCISEQPQLPVSEDQAETVEFDRLVAPDVPQWEATEWETLGSPNLDPMSPVAGSPATVNLQDLPAPFAAGPHGFNGVAPLGHRSGATPGSTDRPLPPPLVSGPDLPLPPAYVPPSAMDVTPLTSIPMPPAPGSGDPLLPPEHLGPFAPETNRTDIRPPVGTPEQPVPVPESGTLLLVGSGIVSLLRRARSRAHARRQEKV